MTSEYLIRQNESRNCTTSKLGRHPRIFHGCNKNRQLATKAELIVMQELHNGLYFCQTEDTDVFDQAETIQVFYRFIWYVSEGA